MHTRFATAFLCLAAAVATTTAQPPVHSATHLQRQSAAAPSSVRDTVRVSGRVTLGSGIIDTSGISIYLQDDQGNNIHARGPRVSGVPRFVPGDSVVVTGQLTFGANGPELTNAVPVLVHVPRRQIEAGSVPLYARQLDSAKSGLVRISGTVATASVGRGDHMLKLVNRIPGADSSEVYVAESEESIDAMGLERFEPEDLVRATGVLIRHPAGQDGRWTYYLIPRASDDVQSIGWSRSIQRQVTVAILAVIALLVVLTAAIHARRAVAAASDRADTALRESEGRYRLLVEEAPVGILVHRRGRVLFVNSTFATMLGLREPEELVGGRLVDLIHVDDRLAVTAWIRELRQRRERAVRARGRFRRTDGAPIEIEIAATPIAFRGENAVQVIVHDVTAQVELEDRLRHSHKMEAIGQLAAGVAHDFNNMLTAIAGYTQLILDEYALNDGLKHDVQEIQRAGERASGLTKQLLAVSRRQLVLAEVIDLNDVIGSAGQLFQRTIGEHIALDVSLAVTPCPVFADRGQLEQVIMNLVLNARDAMPRGGQLQVETRHTAIEESSDLHVATGLAAGDYVALVVRDSGVGMSPETQRRIFDPFFTTKPVGDGNGLGLAAMYGIVTGAHGHVSVKSTERVGSEFTVLLPRVRQAAAPDVRRYTPTPRSIRAYGARILLIEDEASVRTATRRILEHGGFEVHEAKNGTDAVLLWEENGGRFDCIISDVVLPGIRGPELVERFRFDRPSIPVLFVSGYTDRALGRLDLEIPNTSFLQKPFEPKQIAAALADLLREAAIAA